MLSRSIATLTLSLAFAAASWAQDAGDDSGASGSSMAGQLHSSGVPVGWEGAVANAFFAQGGELLPRAELRRNWDRLDDEQQRQVAGDCQIFMRAEDATALAVDQSSVANAAPNALGDPAGELTVDTDRGLALRLEDALPGALEAPGKEEFGVTDDPQIAKLHELCTSLAGQ